MLRKPFFIIILFFCFSLTGQDDSCQPILSSSALSQRLANYDIKVDFDHESHKVSGTERISWLNNSPDTVYTLRLYMYLNAFKNSRSSYLKGSGMNIMGQNLQGRKKEDWGWVKVLKAAQLEDTTNSDLHQTYVQPDDENEDDQTVLEIILKSPVLPGTSTTLDLTFESKLPRTIARSGYANHDFNHFVHWYPKLGVYEEDAQGYWGWNCHQFLRQMEFYGDHGNYKVTIISDPKFTIGGSGCIETYKSPLPNDKSRVVTTLYAEDVIDFGWVASPLLKEYNDYWNDVAIRILSPEGHENLVPRLFHALKGALQYFDDHVGKYPYTTLTALDPPVHGLRSGFMEYPTYITGGSFYNFPKSVRSMESLIVHEFAHQYFMQMMANNEKEQPWLDEGFVTFYEDCVMESIYGESSLIDMFGYKVSNSSLTRNEYASLPNRRISKITQTGYKVEGSYKGIIYSKTATFLKSLQGYLGEEAFDEMMKSYFENNKFTHPRKNDFVQEVKQAFAKNENILSSYIDTFLHTSLEETKICDYAVTGIFYNEHEVTSGWVDEEKGQKNPNMSYLNEVNKTTPNNIIRLERLGDFIAPLEVALYFEDGTSLTSTWSGRESLYYMIVEEDKRVVSVDIDPERKLFLDIDFNNNSYTRSPKQGGILKYAFRSLYWLQNTFQSVSFLM